MRVRTPIDIGAAIRDRRQALQLDQKALAERIGVSRQWVTQVERGKANAQLGLVLRALEALGIPLSIADADLGAHARQTATVDIDQIIDQARETKR